jgi:hypothetical protein
MPCPMFESSQGVPTAPIHLGRCVASTHCCTCAHSQPVPMGFLVAGGSSLSAMTGASPSGAEPRREVPTVSFAENAKGGEAAWPAPPAHGLRLPRGDAPPQDAAEPVCARSPVVPLRATRSPISPGRGGKVSALVSIAAADHATLCAQELLGSSIAAGRAPHAEAVQRAPSWLICPFSRKLQVMLGRTHTVSGYNAMLRHYR